MYSEAKRYLRYLSLIRQDIKEEFDLLGIPDKGARICDLGCGNGITTFGLALETEGTECLGIDLFGKEMSPNLALLEQFVAILRNKCEHAMSYVPEFPGDLCKLVSDNRVPRFRKGNIVLGQNLPKTIDVAYCKKVLINLWGKVYSDTPWGKEGLLKGLKNIVGRMQFGGKLYAIEYDQDGMLAEYFEMSNLNILHSTQIKRKEIRSRGRTNTVSTLRLYLCQKTA